jgi:hypothetical protein
MAIDNVDARIEQMIAAKKTIINPGGNGEKFEVTVSQGSTPMVASRPAGDITIRVSDPAAQNRVDAQQRKDNRLHTEAVTEIVEIGTLRIERNKATGWERRYQKFDTDYFVFENGAMVHPSKALAAIFEILKTTTITPKERKK